MIVFVERKRFLQNPDDNTNELLSGGITNYFESGTMNSCIFAKSGTTNSWLFNRRIMNSIKISCKTELKTL